MMVKKMSHYRKLILNIIALELRSIEMYSLLHIQVQTLNFIKIQK